MTDLHYDEETRPVTFRKVPHDEVRERRAVKVLVTGAEEHQGLAIIRGLGLAGVPVVACGAIDRSLGSRSRFAVESHRYVSPLRDKRRFLEDILGIVERSGAGLIIPGVESTLVALDEFRAEVGSRCMLAAPDTLALGIALDKLRTLQLAREVGVPVPRTVHASTIPEILDDARELRFPVAIKPRGSAIHAGTRHALGFKVRYAHNLESLKEQLASMDLSAGAPLIQEYTPGVGVCVSALYAEGRPIVRFPYLREREWPITGGISVVRRSLAQDPRLESYVDLMLGRVRWHGIAMVEFKYEEPKGYTLMEINGRFQASTALSLDAGLNLPYMVYRLYTTGAVETPAGYRIGVRERWLRGDWLSLLDYLLGDTIRSASRVEGPSLPSRSRVLADFLGDFRRGVHYDEFKTYDWRPGLTEALWIFRLTLRRLRSIAAARYGRLRTKAGVRSSRASVV